MIDIDGNEFWSKDQNRHHPRGAICHHYSRFKLTCDEYDRLRARAQDRCEICRTSEVETIHQRLVIDHFSGKPACYVRGLVCDTCNQVMACHDGNRNWGPKTSPFREQAAAYAANSWHSPEYGLRLQNYWGPLDDLGWWPRPWLTESACLIRQMSREDRGGLVWSAGLLDELAKLHGDQGGLALAAGGEEVGAAQ